MMRSLWTAASGMKSQQSMVDTISNNLSNVNTTGYKKERLEFKSLLYETIREGGSTEQGASPVNLQVGHGVQTAASVKAFTQGVFETTKNPLDFSVEGDGFFAVRDDNGNVRYSRNGAFKMSINSDGNMMLANASGQAILSTDGEPIVFEEGVSSENLEVDGLGNFKIMRNGAPVDLGIRMQIVQFENVQGLKSKGGGLYETTTASGRALLESENANLESSKVVQGGLEGSNVEAVEEMVKLIVAQRAYELSSKAIQTSDDMLSLANQLKN